MAQIFDELNKLHERGELITLVRCGAISPTTYQYYKIAKDYRAMKAKKSKITMHDIYLLCDRYQYSHVIIYKAIKQFC